MSFGRGRSCRRPGLGSALAVFAAAVAAWASPSAAFEFFDGRIEVHGAAEEQIRVIAKNFNGSNGWDLSQWYNVLSMESDLNIAPDGFGPFDLVSGFVRAEVRYDCIWTHACGVSHAVNAWGFHNGNMPVRSSDAHKSGYTGTLFTGDVRHLQDIPVDRLGFADKDTPVYGNRKLAYLWHVPGVDTLFGVPNPCAAPGAGCTSTGPDPAFYVFQDFVKPSAEYRFALRQTRGQPDGTSFQVMGPYLPSNKIDPLGALADRANPFNPMDVNPVLVPYSEAHPSFAPTGSTAMPYRPSPQYMAGFTSPNGSGETPRGLFIPNEADAELIRNDKLGQFDQNFSKGALSWNHGASQQDTYELKEAYLDLEMFDSRLWIRAGKQNIVWGKTELFRTTDQFNPQDLALATLPSLEESRIALWSMRGVWSFYSVGPFDDVRAELAFNFDHVEPTDLGRCGEPYTPNPVCDKTAGLYAHGLVGTALTGEIRPPDPWKSVKGLEIGGRVEWRWDRFSFALSDFWGYDDYPYLKAVFYYTRNVDPITGRPRTGQSQAGCDPDNLHGGDTSGCLTPDQALAHQSANQQRFAVICASSIGFNNLDPSVCAQSVLNSNRNLLTSAPDVAPTIAETLSDVIAGSTYGKRIVQNPAFAGVPLPLVSLNADYNDGPGGSVVAPNDSLAAVLTDQQEALLGCGAFYHTSCDVSTSQAYGGIDLLNTEMSVMIQSWPGFPGTWNDWSTQSGPNGPIQPGTIRNCSAKPGSVGCGGLQGWVAFAGGTVARRYEGGNVYTLPGARSPWSQATELSPSLWNAGVDGCARAVNPATGLPDPGCQLSNGGAGAHDLVVPTGGAFSTQYSGDPFQSEMAALSWNFMITLVSLSGIGKPNVACPANTLPSQRSGCRLIDEFLPSDPNGLQLRPGGQPGCSLAKPQLCANIQAIYAVAHTTRRSVIAGGNGTFGRTDFDWHQGGSGVLEYKKRNVLGFSMDFAEDRTKSNWGIESTWIEGNQFEDHDSVSGLSTSSTLNLTVSVDRPTFINFLNRGRTFFFNSQWFFQYVPGYHSGFVSTGPFNVLATFHVDTGYFRDRLLPAITIVYDLKSHSGAILPELAYRFTENLSATISLNLFSGRFQKVTPPLYSVADFPYRAGRDQKWDWTEQGLSPVRDNDEIALRLRYTY